MYGNELKMVVRVAKLYYELSLSQEEIARRESISKSTVSRMIKRAAEEGFVKVTVEYPIESAQELEEEFRTVFGLDRVFLSTVIVDNEELIRRDVCKSLCLDLAKMLRDGDIVGVSWGNTMNCIAEQLVKLPQKGMRIVQLNGGISKNIRPTKAAFIMERFAEASNGVGYILPTPAIVDSNRIVEVITEDSHISRVFELIREARVAVFSIGCTTLDSVLFGAEYFTAEEYARLQRAGAVGDICSRFYDIEGNLVDPALDTRTIGISLQELRKKEYGIGIAVGTKKTKAILGALRGGYLKALYTDENTARSVLNLHRRSLAE